MKRMSFPSQQEWSDEIQDIIRGAAGGFLFGIPLLYTMEVWWIGSYTEPPLMLAILATTFVIVFLLNRTDGFRQMSPDRPTQAATDTIEAIAISTICATLILVLLREITSTTPLDEALGKIVLEGVPFALGVALARSILQGDRFESSQAAERKEAAQETPSEQSGHPPSASKPSRYNATLADIGATLIGTIIIAFNIAPTDEVPMLVAAASPPWLIAIVLASLLISYSIVFMAGFTTQQRRIQQQGPFQHPVTETLVSYLISLLAAALMLWFFHRLSFADPWTSWLENTVILGLPATIGGAAGRLAV
jgi:putative integral membrane protein (TIGR02587 family)